MGDAGGPILATVIPVFNEAASIQACLESLVQQSLDPTRHMILVLDGGSTDGTEELVEDFIKTHQGAQWPRLVAMENPHRTVAHARNLALEVLPSTVEFVVEMIGHATVGHDHLEQRLNAWDGCLGEAGEQLAGVGVQVLPSDKVPSRTARWIEGSLASPLGQSGGQFSAFPDVNPPRFLPSSCIGAHRSKPWVVGMRPSSRVKTATSPCDC